MKRITPRNALVLGVVLLAVAAGAWMLGRQVNFGLWVDRSVAFFREAGPLPFFVAMALLPVAGFPLSPFTLMAGPVFGPVLGVGYVIFYSLMAVTVNVTISYWVAARALRPLVSRLVQRLGYSLPEVQAKAAWTMVLLVRIVPGPPFFLQSYLLGLARVPFGVYLLVSTIVPAAYLSATILFGDALLRGDRWAMAGAVVVFFVAGGILHQLRRRFGRAKERGSPDPC